MAAAAILNFQFMWISPFCVSPMIHVSWPNLAKISRCKVAEKSSGIACKKTRRQGHVRAPISPPLSRSHPKFRERCQPWAVHVYRLGPDRLRFAGVIPERVQKSQYNIGWKLLRRLSPYNQYNNLDTVWINAVCIQLCNEFQEIFFWFSRRLTPIQHEWTTSAERSAQSHQ